MSLENQVWTEKFRPSSLDEVIGHDEKVERLKRFIDEGSTPHLLFHGPPGTGKTASAIGMARDMYGDQWKSNFISKNASDSRGIDEVRDTLKPLAAQSASGKFKRKIVFLDEFEQMTSDAQAALRRIMEKYSDQTIFILSCNWINQIISPIQSRCSIMTFDKLKDSEIEELALRVLNEEGIEYTQQAVDEIVDKVAGDARRTIHTLQTSVVDGELALDNLSIAGGQVDSKTVEQMVSLAINGEMEDAHELVVTEVLPSVTDYSRFTGTLMRKIKDSDDIPRDVRWYAISQIGDLERNIQEGCNPNVQIVSLLSKLPILRYSSMPTYD
jgi:replication factor C small subunit